MNIRVRAKLMVALGERWFGTFPDVFATNQCHQRVLRTVLRLTICLAGTFQFFFKKLSRASRAKRLRSGTSWWFGETRAMVEKRGRKKEETTKFNGILKYFVGLGPQNDENVYGWWTRCYNMHHRVPVGGYEATQGYFHVFIVLEVQIYEILQNSVEFRCLFLFSPSFLHHGSGFTETQRCPASKALRARSAR